MNVSLSIFSSIKWLTALEMALYLLNLIVLIWHFIPNKKHFRAIDFVPGLGMIMVHPDETEPMEIFLIVESACFVD